MPVPEPWPSVCGPAGPGPSRQPDGLCPSRPGRRRRQLARGASCMLRCASDSAKQALAWRPCARRTLVHCGAVLASTGSPMCRRRSTVPGRPGGVSGFRVVSAFAKLCSSWAMPVTRDHASVIMIGVQVRPGCSMGAFQVFWISCKQLEPQLRYPNIWNLGSCDITVLVMIS